MNQSSKLHLRRILKTLGVSLALLALPQASHAAGVVSGAKVTLVRVDRSGLGMVFFDRPIGNTPPDCRHPAYYSALSFDTRTPGGRAILALALATRSSGAEITVYGSGRCDIYGGHVEDWDYGVGT